MLNLNASENDPHKIDTFKETDQLVDNFYSNFKTFQGKFDVKYMNKKYSLKSYLEMVPSH